MQLRRISCEEAFFREFSVSAIANTRFMKSDSDRIFVEFPQNFAVILKQNGTLDFVQTVTPGGTAAPR